MFGRGHRIRHPARDPFSAYHHFVHSLNPWTPPRYKNTLSPARPVYRPIFIIPSFFFDRYTVFSPCFLCYVRSDVYFIGSPRWCYVAVTPDGIEPWIKVPKACFSKSGQVRCSYSSKRRRRRTSMPVSMVCSLNALPSSHLFVAPLSPVSGFIHATHPARSYANVRGGAGSWRTWGPVYLTSAAATYGRTYEQRARDRVNCKFANPTHINKSEGKQPDKNQRRSKQPERDRQ